MTADDRQLLQEFTRDQSQDAFAALVQRHLGLVYSAALRQARSPQLAEDISQAVFTDLAQQASRLKPDTILPAWLYEVTRRTAINVIRGETRRQLREQVASEMNAMNATEDDWTQIAPLLDDAMSSLDETDRAAVLLRYFENKSFREVGQTLGSSDDAAQKRVSRAVERLREFFNGKGIPIGTAGLVAIISTNAVQAAPPALSLAISTTAMLSAATTPSIPIIAATKTIGMTALQKTIVVTSFAAAIGFGIYEARQSAHLRDELEKLRRQQASNPAGSNGASPDLSARVKGLSNRNDELSASLAKANAEMARLRTATQEAQRSAKAFKELAEQANQSGQDLTNELTTVRHVFARFGKLALRAARLKSEDTSQLSETEKKAREEMKMNVISELLNVVKAGTKVGLEDKSKPETPDTRADYVACMLYGALGLDERQFGSTYDLLLGSYQQAEQKNLLNKEVTPEITEAAKQLSQQVRADIERLLTPEQIKTLGEISNIIPLIGPTASFSINF